MSMNCGLRFKFAIQNKTEPNLRKKSIRICFFQSDSLTKPSVINDNILDFKIRFLLLLIMKLSLLLYFPFATTILKALDGCPFSALNDFFLCFVYYFLLQEMMMMTTTTYFVVGLLCCQLSLLLNELNFPAKNDLFVTQCQMSQVLKQPKKMLK